MNRKIKGQGALEYLLLIGGAVLIAVIVIALFVGMGGQSREAAQEQADRAQQASDVPQPAQIVSVAAKFDDCDVDAGAGGGGMFPPPPPIPEGEISLSWRPIGEGGTYRLFIEDSQRRKLHYIIAGTTYTGEDATNAYILSSSDDQTLDVGVFINPGIISNNTCGDSYYIYITTEKNQQTVSSARFRFGWWGN